VAKSRNFLRRGFYLSMKEKNAVQKLLVKRGFRSPGCKRGEVVTFKHLESGYHPLLGVFV